MSNLAVAKRYGQALFELASEKNILDQLEKELTEVMQVIEESDELKKVVEHQLMNAELKQEIFRKIYSDNISSTTLNFLLLILHKRREIALGQIVNQFINLANEAKGIVKAQVKSATLLSPEHLEELRESLVKMTGKNILLEVTIDEKLMGGVVVRIGDRIIDGSVSTKLKMLEKHLKSVGLD
ncbi:MAG: hypothetical protein APF76_17610 [Desulfitibacter sp. BRH_c19]|nr:MAG: hypothetical protein APF76_17610 [Desulfitibacter sp. BRH_c19]